MRAVVLTGNGPAFCAGFDLKEIRERDQRGEPFRPPMNRPGRNLFEVVTETPVPVIAALTGAAVAGGFELALACDLRVAAPGHPAGPARGDDRHGRQLRLRRPAQAHPDGHRAGAAATPAST